jgi:hypothetical protein
VLNILIDEKVFANTPTNNKGNKIFYTLFAQHVSTLTWVLFRCSFTTQHSHTCVLVYDTTTYGTGYPVLKRNEKNLKIRVWVADCQSGPKLTAVLRKNSSVKVCSFLPQILFNLFLICKNLNKFFLPMS